MLLCGYLQFIFHNEGFDKPFFTTYLKTASFVLYLPWVGLRHVCQKDMTTKLRETSFKAINNVSIYVSLMVNTNSIFSKNHGKLISIVGGTW